MNSLIESLNGWGARFLDFAWPMFWQSTLLIALIFAIEFVLRRKVRAAVRYALWLAVLIKLLLPPSLALPTSLAWWLRPSAAAPASTPAPTFVVTANASTPTLSPLYYPAPPIRPKPETARTPISPAAWALIGWCCMSLGLLGWLVIRWQRVTGRMQRAARTPSPATGVTLQELFDETKRAAGVRRVVRLRLVEQPISPAVYGLFQPVILLPQSLVERIAPEQLRAVLLHELIHFRRADVWINCAQSLLQIVYWWHPLVWFANARIRRVREEAVDDAVMLALRSDAEHYAPALLEVAKLALNRPLAALGLVGILESRSALHQRVERLMNFTTPGRAGLSIVSVLGIAAFTALAVPMGEAPPKATVRVAQSSVEHTEPTRVHGGANDRLPFDLTADVSYRYPQFGITIAQNNVVIKLRGNTITADSALINQPDGTLLLNQAVMRRVGDMDMPWIRCESLCYHFEPDASGISDQSNSPSHVVPVITISIPAEGGYWLGTNSLDLAQLRVVFLAAKEAAKEFNVRIEAAETARIEAIARLCDLCQELGITRLSLRTPRETPAETNASASLEINPPAPTTASPAKKATSPTESGKSNANPDGFRLENLDLDLELGRPPGKSGLEELGSQVYSSKVYHVSFYSNPIIYVTAEGQYRSGTNVLDLPGVRSWLASATNKSSGGALAIRADERAPYASVQALLELYKELGLRSNLRTTPFQSGGPKFGTNGFEYVARYVSPAVAERRSAESKRVDQAQVSSNHNTVVVPSSARQALMSKLDQIRVSRFSCDGEPLWDVIRRLANETRELDPDKKGIRILLGPEQNAAPSASGTIDPNTGLPVAAPASLAEHYLDSVVIRLKVPLTDVRLADVLDAIAKSADKPIKYAFLDYGVVFSPKSPQPELYMRSFRVDPNTFFLRLQEAGAVSGSVNAAPYGQRQAVVPRVHAGGTGFENWNGSGGDGLKFVTTTNSMDVVQTGVINFFLSLGADLRPGTGKNIFYGDRYGNLMVNATKQDLDIIEAALQTLNAPQHQINLKVKFVELGSADGHELGLESMLDFSRSQSFRTNNPPDGTNAPVAVLGILTAPQFRNVLKALEKRDGADLINESQVTTLSGRQAQIQVVDERILATYTKALADATKALAHGTKGLAIPTNSVVEKLVIPSPAIPTGPTLDVIPVLGADGDSIQMRLIPTLVDFQDVTEVGPAVLTVPNIKSNGVAVATFVEPAIFPRFRVRQVSLDVTVWDGQTVVLGSFEPNPPRIQHKVPVLGDLPGVGRLFRSETSAPKKKNILIFVTPTLLEPSGNRVHTEEK